MSKRILFSAVRNEGPFLLEWIAYHRAIGFDTILIVSNDCDDGTTELLDALHAAGVVHHISQSVGPDASPQGRAAAAANASGVVGDGDWVIWLDADEFLNIHAGEGHLDDLIAAIGPAQGILIPWRIFGDGGNASFPGRFVSDRFTGAAAFEFKGNASVKTLYRHRTGGTMIGSIMHRPRLVDPKGYRAADFLTATGHGINPDFEVHARWLSGVEGRGNFNLAPGEFSWDLAQINHYMVRTGEMYALKKLRGRGFRSARKIKSGTILSDRHTLPFFLDHNRNDETDTSILRHREATDAKWQNS